MASVFGMIVVTILLNQTTGRAAIPVFYELLHKWPTPRLLADADLSELTRILQPIGLHNIRARRLKLFGQTWCERPPRQGVLHKSRVAMPQAQGQRLRRRKAQKGDEMALRDVYPATEISHLPGVGRYALDSFRLFRPSLEVPERAAVQVALEHKLTSEKWLEILSRREKVGESRFVGSLLPAEDGIQTENLEHDWAQVKPLDKELEAYRLWRKERQSNLAAYAEAPSSGKRPTGVRKKDDVHS